MQVYQRIEPGKRNAHGIWCMCDLPDSVLSDHTRDPQKAFPKDIAWMIDLLGLRHIEYVLDWRDHEMVRGIRSMQRGTLPNFVATCTSFYDGTDLQKELPQIEPGSKAADQVMRWAWWHVLHPTK